VNSHNAITCAALSCVECDSADVVTVPDALEAASRLRERAERAEREVKKLRARVAWFEAAFEYRSGVWLIYEDGPRAAHVGTIGGLRFRLAEVEEERADARRECMDMRVRVADLLIESTERGQEIDRITRERAQLTAEIERLRARQSGDHYARVMDVVRVVQRWLNGDGPSDDIRAAMRAYERGEANGEASE
jgi:hypothetical protein